MGVRGQDRAFGLADMSASSKAVTCHRTPKYAKWFAQFAYFEVKTTFGFFLRPEPKAQSPEPVPYFRPVPRAPPVPLRVDP